MLVRAGYVREAQWHGLKLPDGFDVGPFPKAAHTAWHVEGVGMWLSRCCVDGARMCWGRVSSEAQWRAVPFPTNAPIVGHPLA